MDDRKEKLKQFLRRIVTDPRRADIGLHAANGAYYLFFSLGPLTALLLSLLPYTSLTEQRLMEALAVYMPAPLGLFLRSVVSDIYALPSAALGLSAAAELWSAARLLSSVVRGVGELSGGGTDGYLRRRVMGAAYTLLLIVFLLGNLMLLLFGERLIMTVSRRWPEAEPLCRLMLGLRPLLLLAGLTSLNALLFRHAPKREKPLRFQLPGAAFSAAVWLLFTKLYSLALERFGLFGVYGSIAAVIVSLYWAYCSLYILFGGVWLNSLREPSPLPDSGSPPHPARERCRECPAAWESHETRKNP